MNLLWFFSVLTLNIADFLSKKLLTEKLQFSKIPKSLGGRMGNITA